MSEQMIADLVAWEAGELSLEDLVGAHPGQAVESLVRLHDELASAAERETPDTDAVWPIVASRLPDRTPSRRGVKGRALIAAVAAAVLTASVAMASPETMRGVVDGVRHGVATLFGIHAPGDGSSTSPAPSVASPAPGGTAPRSGRDADGSTTSSGTSSGQDSAGSDRDGGSTGTSSGDQGGGGSQTSGASDGNTQGSSTDGGSSSGSQGDSSSGDQSPSPSDAGSGGDGQGGSGSGGQ